MASYQPNKPQQLSLPLNTESAVRLAERQRGRVVLLLAQLLLSAASTRRDGDVAAEGASDEPH